MKIGTILSIKLPNDKYAFARMFKDGVIGVYQKQSISQDDFPKEEEYSFFVGIYKFSLKKWKIIGHKPFYDVDSSWPPKMFIHDVISDKYNIYYKGEIKCSTKEECMGLECAAVWDTEQIIDRLMGDNKWNISV